MLMWLLPYCCVVLSCAGLGSDVRAKTVMDYTEPGVRYPNVAVSLKALQRGDVVRWGDVLNASEAQLHVMEAQYARFVEEHNALLDREAPKLLRASSEAHLAREAEGFTDEYTDRMAALIRQGALLRRQLEQVEQDYINSIEPFLTEEQVERLPLLRNEAVRRQCRIPLGIMPWVRVDVRSLWEEFDQSRVSPDDRELIYEMLREHDQVMTPLIRNMTDSHWRNAIENARIVPDWQSGAMSHEEYVRRFEGGRERIRRSLIQLNNLNETAAKQIAEALPEPVAREFHSSAHSDAYPELYPDSYALHDVFTGILANEELEHDMDVAVEELANAYDDEYRQLADQIHRFYFNYARESSLGSFEHLPQDLPAALEPMLQQRRELSQQWMQQLAETVGEDVLSRHGLNADETDADEADEQAEA